MPKMSIAAIGLVAAGFATAASAQMGAVKLTAPENGAMLDTHKTVQVAYEVVPGPKVDHVHLYVDGKEMAVLRETMGTHMVPALPAGAHDICIKAVTKAHVPTGLEQCNKVTVK